jgi:hypothetical protein
MSKVKNTEDTFSLDDLVSDIDDTVNNILESELPGGLINPKNSKDNDSNDDDDDPDGDSDNDGDDDSDTDDGDGEDNDEGFEDNSDDDSDSDNDNDDDDFAIDIITDIHKELGFDDNISSEDFEKDFGKGVEGIKNYIKTIIQENSKPVFENDLAKDYYDFIAKGGDPREFSNISKAVNDFKDISNEDISDDESVQKSVYAEYLKITNPKKDAKWVSSKVEKLYESGLLEEEALDALDTVKDHYVTLEKENLKAIEVRKEQEKKAVEEFWKQEATELESTKEIAGVPLNSKLKKDFLEYYKSGKFNEDVKDATQLRELAFIKFIGVNQIKKTVTSKVSTELETKLRRYTSSSAKTSSKSNKTVRDITSIDDLEI